MAALTARHKKVAITLPGLVLEVDRMGVVVAVKGHGEGLEVDPIAFLCIALGFLDLADHPVIHFLYLLVEFWLG